MIQMHRSLMGWRFSPLIPSPSPEARCRGITKDYFRFSYRTTFPVAPPMATMSSWPSLSRSAPGEGGRMAAAPSRLKAEMRARIMSFPEGFATSQLSVNEYAATHDV